MTLALYRKYRPMAFDELVGQDHVTTPLMAALRNGRLNHAYLFSGPRGCGKTSSARILARSLNCEEGPTPTPCGKCDSCEALAPGGPGSLDVIEIDAASHGGVDDARDLRERAFFAPASSRFKVYVIDEAHMVSSAGFNALLKLVEEPPPYVMFVFATTEPEKVLATIKSRTHHYPFRLIPPGVLRPYLEKICLAEGVQVEPAVFPLVVRAGGGSARDSLSILDQLIAGAGEGGVTYASAVALLGVTDGGLLDEACDALAAADGAELFATVDRVVEAGHDPRRFATDLLDRLRDLIVLHQVPDAAAKGLLDYPPEQLEKLTSQALRLGPASLSRIADIIHNGLTDMRGTTAPRLVLELICARALLPAADAPDSPSSLAARVERLELGSPSLATGSPAPARTAAPRSAPARPAVTPAPLVTASAPPPTATPAPQVPVTPASPVSPGSASGPSTPPATTARVETPQAPPATSPAAEAAMSLPAAAPAATLDPSAVTLATVHAHWEEILAAAKRRKMTVSALLRDAEARDLEGNVLVLAVRSDFHAKSLSAGPAFEVFTESLNEVLGVKWTVRCEVGDGGPARPAAQVPPPRSAPGSVSEPPVPAAPAGPPPDFDPGDEPLDAAEEAKAVGTAQDQALALLKQTLGAEKIEE